MLLALALARSQHDVPTANCTCEAFCAGRCSFLHPGDAGRPQTIRLLRLARPGDTGLGDRDAGDVYGDLAFVMRLFYFPMACRADPSTAGCFLASADDAVILDYQVSVDGQYGPYSECNPAGVGGVHGAPFECEPDVGVPDGCLCARTRRAVGRTGLQHRYDGYPAETRWGRWRVALARLLRGSWFSLPGGGECASGAVPNGTGCTWGDVRLVGTANASCVLVSLQPLRSGRTPLTSASRRGWRGWWSRALRRASRGARGRTPGATAA